MTQTWRRGGEYEIICDNVADEIAGGSEDIKRDFLIGNYFKLTKHCEEMGTEELQFVHRSIYEYFVVVHFYESICKSASGEEVAGKLGILLKCGRLSEQILEFIKYKFDKMGRRYLPDITREVFQIMLLDGMTFHTGIIFRNVIEREQNIFANMLEIMHLWNPVLGKLHDNIITYLRCNNRMNLKLSGISLNEAYLSEAGLSEPDLRGLYLRGSDLRGSDLSGTDLSRSDLSESDLSGSDLSGSDLSGTDLSRTDLSRSDLRRTDLSGSNLSGTDLSESDLRWSELSGAELSEADLEGTILDEIQLRIVRRTVGSE